MKQKTVVSNAKFWKLLFVVCAFSLASVAPLYFGGRTNAESAAGTLYLAPLTGAPLGGVTPNGFSRYTVDASGVRVFETQVGSVNLPAATALNVFVDGAAAGQLRLTTTRSGYLRLSTGAGQTVPTVNPGSAVTVKNGETTVLAGAFVAPTPSASPSPSASASPSATRTPWPSPSASPSATRTPYPSPTPWPTPSAAFFAQLSGATIDGVMPRGFGQYAEFGATAKKLNFYVDRVRLPQGTRLAVFVGDAAVGEIVLDADGDGALRLDTATGATVPTVANGATATVKNGAATVLAGTFQPPTTFPTPTPTASPSPSASPTPTRSPTPTPTASPRPNRYFGGRLSGAQVVPAVTTEARGVVYVALNAAETEAQVYLAFNGLSSAQTTATVNAPAMAGETAAPIYTFAPLGGTSGRFPVATVTVTAEQVAQLRTGLWYVQIASADRPNGEIRGQIRSRTRNGAFSGAATEDIAVFRPSNGTWYVKDGAGYAAQTLGQPGDEPVSGDYDGDGKTDYAVFRAGTWLIGRSADGGLTTRQFGLAGDIPVRGDYDGDGRLDLAVFRPSNGVWYVQKSNGAGYIITQFGQNGDRPVASDLDGDGRTDLAVFRPSNGTWYWLKSSTGAFAATQFGTAGDVPLAGDFDGDGADDVSVYRPSTGVWYIWKSGTGGYDIRQFGTAEDVPVAGNYDGDGVTDVAVFRPSTGVWYVWRSSDDRYDFNYFGLGSDLPATKP